MKSVKKMRELRKKRNYVKLYFFSIALSMFLILFSFSAQSGDQIGLSGMGNNYYGQLGIGEKVFLYTPEIIECNKVIAVASGYYHSLFIKADGSLWAMGRNTVGQLGDGTTIDRNTPIQIESSGVIAVAAGWDHSLYVKSDGSLWGMGRNDDNKLTNNALPFYTLPVKVINSGVTDVAAGWSHSLFIKSNGSLWGMGRNTIGQLGQGKTYFIDSPVQIEADGVKTVVTRYGHSLYIKSDGSLWGMGYNNVGQLGDGTITIARVPIQIVSSGIISVATGWEHSLFVKSDGSLWGMGSNGSGQLGVGEETPYSLMPIRILNAGVIESFAGCHNSFYAKTDGSIWGTGLNDNYQLGIGTTQNIFIPVQIESNGALTGVAGSAHTLFLKDAILHSYYIDGDQDGYGDPDMTIQDCSPPAGYVDNDEDCNDSDKEIHPGATEVCNNMDDNCNGVIDEGVHTTFYRDNDNDGYGNPDDSVLACLLPVGYSVNNTDCNDNDASINPDTVWYKDSDGDGFGDAGDTTESCVAPSGYVADDTDCDDNDPNQYPGQTWYKDQDGDGYSNGITATNCNRQTGYELSSELTDLSGDCDDSQADINPGAPELFNQIDDNCNNQVDEIWADMTVKMNSLPKQIRPGKAITYKVTTTNAGPTSVGEVIITCDIDQEVEIPRYSLDEGQTWLDWQANLYLSGIEEGTARNLLIMGTVSQDVKKTISSTCSVDSDLEDPDESNSRCTCTTPLEKRIIPWINLLLN